MEAKNAMDMQPDTAVQQAEPPRGFTVGETVFAWLSLVAGYLFFRATPVAQHPFGAFLFVILLYATTVVFLFHGGIRLRSLPLMATLSAVAVSVSLLLCANPMIHRVAYTYALAAYLYVIYAAAGNSLKSGFFNLILADFFRALFILPFASLGSIFSAMFANGGKKGGKVFLRVLLGVSIALVPTVLVCGLLSYDNDFMALMNRLFNWDINIFSHIGSLILGIPVGMYVFGAYISAAEHKCTDIMTCDDCERIWKNTKVLPALTALGALLPILLVYVIFFISQWKYYVACFVGELPFQTVYSEYARDGFFQLCTVAVLNFIMLSAVAFFTARKGEGPSVIQRVLTVLLSVATLILISTAMAKMAMYIDCYGLTPKRVYASWFMVVLAAVFLLIILQQCIRKIKLIPAGIMACVLLFAVLAFSNADALIARYNVDRYLAGTLRDVDVVAMEELGDSAVPEMVRLVKVLDERDGRDIADFPYGLYRDTGISGDALAPYETIACYLYSCADRVEDGLFSMTIPRIHANAALKRAGISSK